MKMQNRQALSHKAKNHQLFIKQIISQGMSEKFSDTQIYNKLPINSLNTIRKIRHDLEVLGILRHSNENLPNNEKLYEVKNKKKILSYLYYYSELVAEKTNGVISHYDEASYFGKYGPLMKIKYYPPILKKISHYYPIKLYKKNLCPVCQGKLHGLRSGLSILDKRCSKCKFTFYFRSYILGCEKPFKNRKPLEVRPWYTYRHPARQKAMNKIVSKILREM